MSNSHYSQLVKDHVRQSRNQEGVDGNRKRRRIKKEVESIDLTIDDKDNNSASVAADNDNDNDDDDDSDDFEDVDLGPKETTKDSNDNSDSDALDFESEQRDYSFLDKPEEPEDNTITISLARPEEPKSTKKRVQFIDKEARNTRLLLHQWYLVTLICHGVIRNSWCNEPRLIALLRKSISSDVHEELKSIRSHKGISAANSVRFVGLIRQLMFDYSKKFKISKQGLIRKNWNELSIHQSNIDRNVNIDKFRQLVTRFQGSRDIGAQGFVALLRSLGLKVRLIFSLQPPDFTMITELPKIEIKNLEKEKPKPKDSKQAFLQSVKDNQASKFGHKFPNSTYPIFWIEIWNKYNKKWLSVDPIVLKIVETPPMRRKSSFEPPMSDATNNLLYVIAFDGSGKIKDVTRRYASEYNSKTVKKRVGSKSEALSIWYSKMINSFNSVISHGKITPDSLTRLDILELKEFRDRDLCEGMPNNAAGFKDHPIYALESQLRQNEIIHPKDDTTKVGTFRFKLSGKSKKSDLVPVYKRSAVHYLRSAKAWYLRGRVLKVGQQPLRIKKAKKTKRNFDEFFDDDGDDDNDDEATRLYAEFQTKLYIPPPVTNGIINKNAYGNIDIYVPTMIPDGGFLIPIDKAPVFLIEKAAKMLEVDYARAIVAFDFGKQGAKTYKKIPNAREGGVLVAEENKDAIFLVLDELIEEEEAKKRKKVELNSLTNWKFFITKLRIMKRLDKQHGKVEKSKPHKSVPQNGESDQSSDFSVYSEDEDQDSDEEFEQGGFFVGDTNNEIGSQSDQEIVMDKGDVNISTNSGDFEDFAESEKNNSSDEEGGFIPFETFDPPKISPKDTFNHFDIEETKSIELVDESTNGMHADLLDRSAYENNYRSTDDFLMDIPDDEFIMQDDGEVIYNPEREQQHQILKQENLTQNTLISDKDKNMNFISESVSKPIAEIHDHSNAQSDNGFDDEFEFEYSDDE